MIQVTARAGERQNWLTSVFEGGVPQGHHPHSHLQHATGIEQGGQGTRKSCEPLGRQEIR